MNVGDLVWVKTNVAGKQLAILMEPWDRDWETNLGFGSTI